MATTRRAFLRQAGGAMAGGVAFSTALGAAVVRASSAGGRRPNIIFAFSDEHRWQSMSFTELPELKTPSMARLAKEGASFTNGISNNPICMPARTMIMTGRWPYATRALENAGAVLDADRQPTLAKVFGAAGYRSCYIGKWHIGMDPAKAGFTKTFVWGNTDHHWKSFFTKSGTSGHTAYDGYNAVGMTDQALEFIGEGAKSSPPFFVMLAWNPPHAVFTDPPPDTKALYPEGSLPLRPNVRIKDKHKVDESEGFRGYHAHITAIDRELGRILQKLDDLDLARDTIVIYTSDHGSMFGSQGKGSKRHPEEESIRVPFLVRWPGNVPAGARPDALLGSIDVFPTLCGLAGIEPPASCHGTNLAAAALGRPCEGPEAQFIMHIANAKEAEKTANDPKAKVFRPFFRGVRTKRYTYAVGVNGPWLLYDNEKDPYQMKNLVDDPAAADVRAACQRQLEALLDTAEYAHMPSDLRGRLLAMPLADRIAWQQREAVEFAAKQRASGAPVEGE